MNHRGAWRLGVAVILLCAIAPGALRPARPARRDFVWRNHLVRLRVASGPPSRIEALILPPGGTPSAVVPLDLRWRIRDVSIGDVDNDGRLDLLATVWKRTRYHHRLAWRPFLYTLTDGRWVPKWLGSRVGRELIEARLARPDLGPSKLVTLERGCDGTRYLTIYHWRGFGFWGDRTLALPRDAARLRIIPAGGGHDRVTVIAANGSLVAEYPGIDDITAGGGPRR